MIGLAWMRRQEGTAIVYYVSIISELDGFHCPVLVAYWLVDTWLIEIH